MRFITYVLLSLLLLTTAQLSASIVNTKHNLSVSAIDSNGTTIKAQTETEICVFCHVPHFASTVGKPLWNRAMPTTNYTLYDSDYLRRMDYPAIASDLGSANGTPGALSRQCLSCHDGTVAVGAVLKLRRNYNGSTIAMNNVDASGSIPAASSTSFGSDLTNHHPVGIEYDPTPVKTTFSDAVRGMELKSTLDANAQVKLYDYAGKKYVECSSCHDPHKENDKFLRVDSSNIHAVNVVNTCISCHDKTGWNGSIHQTATQTYSDPDVLANYGTNVVGDMGCANCHTPHNAGGDMYLTRKVQANTCYQGAASSVNGANCHGTGGAKDIQSIVAKPYNHPVDESTITKKHTDLDVLYGYDSTNDTEMTDARGVGGMSWATNQHAVCMDCHNQHQARAGTHAPDGQWYAASGTTPSNNVSPALIGVTGIKPTTWPALWTQPKNFDILNSATKEYQICLKCHSYWGVGPSLDGATSYVSKSGAILTDVAWEMNINNKSGHPVVIDQNSRTGSYAPRALLAEQLVDVWAQSGNPGLSTMYCSDCHGSDAESGGATNDPKGPHGSTLKYLLKGENQYWPTKPDGALYNLRDINNAGDTGLFCKNCHDLTRPHMKWGNPMTGMSLSCVTCHVAVPHGSPVSRLIGYSNFPEPYNYNGNSLQIRGWKKHDPYSYSRTNAYAPSCGMMMCHRSNYGGYDANPYQ